MQENSEQDQQVKCPILFESSNNNPNVKDEPQHLQEAEIFKEEILDWLEEKVAMKKTLQKLTERLAEYELNSDVVEVPHEGDNENDKIIKALREEAESYREQCQKLECAAAEANEARKQKVDELYKTKKERECQLLQTENQKLKEDNQSLETIRKIQEKDAATEKSALESLLKKLQEENTKLKKHYTSGTDAREMIVQLREENKKLHDKLSKINPGRHTLTPGRYTSTYQDDHNEEDFRHQPKIMQNSSYFDRHSASNALDRYKLPDRPIDTTGASRFDHRDMSNGIDHDRQPYIGKRTKCADFIISREGRNTRYEVPQKNEHSYATPTATNIEEIINRYGRRDERVASNRHQRSASDNSNIEIEDERDKDRYHTHPKTRSYDTEVDNLGLERKSPESSPTMGKIPFYPSNVREIRLNMQVSVTRTSGRNSRGIVRWIGTLPYHDGYFIGVELESESGKNDGAFEGVRYFRCKKDRGVFVKISKIIMAWK